MRGSHERPHGSPPGDVGFPPALGQCQLRFLDSVAATNGDWNHARGRRPIQGELGVREGVNRDGVELLDNISSLKTGPRRGRLGFDLLDDVAALELELDAEILGQRIPPDHVPAPLTGLLKAVVEHLFHLVTVDAAVTETAWAYEIANRFWLFGGCRSEYFFLPIVHCQYRLHRIVESSRR